MNLSNFKPVNEAGVWLTFDGGRFLVGSSKSRRFQAYIAKKARKIHSAEFKADPGKMIDLTNEALAEVCLLGWSGVMDGDQPFPCTPENKRKLLEIPEFREWLAEAAGDMDAFREAMAADAEPLKSGAGVAS